MNSINITDSNFDEIVSKSTVPVVVYFWADWCSDCKSFSPIFDELVHEYRGRMTMVKMNIEKGINTTDKLAVMSTPTLIIFKNGKEVVRFVEQNNKQYIKQVFEEQLSHSEMRI